MSRKENSQKAQIAMKKAHSSLGKLLEEMESQEDCFKLIQQNLAVIGLLKSANLSILEDYAQSCLSLMEKKKQKKELTLLKEQLLKIIQTAQNK